MADILDVEVVVRRNGRMMAGFPYVRRLIVAEAQEIDCAKSGADSTTYVPIPGVNFIPVINAMMFRTDTSGVNFTFNSFQPGGGVLLQLNAGGFFMAIDCYQNNGEPNELVEINNNTGSVSNIRGFVAGQ